MNNYQFYAALLSHEYLFVGLLIASALLHFLIFRRFIITIFDPYLLSLVFSVFGTTSVTFLFLTDYIDLQMFLSFTLSQTVFYIGLFFFKPFKHLVGQKLHGQVHDNESRPADNRNYKLILFYTSSFILLTSQFTVYYLRGIPLLMESRLMTFAGSGGAGILGRIIDVTTISTLYTFFSIIRFDFPRKSELFKYLVAALVVLTMLLSGSKSTFLAFIYTFWAYIVFAVLKNGDYKWHLAALRSKMKLIIGVSILLVVGVIYIQMADQSNSGFFLLALRFVHSADVFWYSYPNKVYLMINNAHPFQALFTDLLGMLRIFRWEELPEAIGITLKNIHHPSNIPEGPNARHNVFGLVYFGFVGGIVFSFFLGLIISFVRNILPRILKNNVVSGIIFSYAVIRLPALETDPMLGLTYVNNLFFIFIPLLVIMLTINGIILRKF